MGVRVEIQGSSEPLHEGHRAGLTIGDPEGLPAASLPGEQCLEEHPQEGVEKRPVRGQSKAQGPWEGQDPLPVVRLRKEMVDRPRGGVGGSTVEAARAEFALAGGGHRKRVRSFRVWDWVPAQSQRIDDMRWLADAATEPPAAIGSGW